MGDQRDERDYEKVGEIEGYQVYVSYDPEGPDREEAMALYREARESMLYRGLAEQEREQEK